MSAPLTAAEGGSSHHVLRVEGDRDRLLPPMQPSSTAVPGASWGDK